ncbi:hypothetical protein L1987_70867 [Smallanthus sonchifolius]|uniref:Uncharacterized protein n=1 Tax=Smallanthus sonchifolius TaxID=185202 RepID=A0ACB9AS73_9ASTR|nr:hypothetical protein L1987_70867 [Smallanthus sonchifolius]
MLLRVNEFLSGFECLGFMGELGLAKGLPLKLLRVFEYASEFLQFLDESGEGALKRNEHAQIPHRHLQLKWSRV